MSQLYSVEMYREAYMLAAVDLKRAWDRKSSKTTKNTPNYIVGDLVLLKNCTNKIWDAKYSPNFMICKVVYNGVYDFQNPLGHI